MIRRCARKWQTKRDVHGAPERGDLDGRHSDIVVGRDHSVEFPAHRPHENRVGGKRSLDRCGPRCGGKKRSVFAAKPAAITGVWIESAECDPWFGDAKPFPQ
ncbi:MAG TPA: hypothetical protein VK494_00935, partial [Gemmatimonadaceae bacterium]|nr:hypothetical protein [Gemmatimonadaceae bacterium]